MTDKPYTPTSLEQALGKKYSLDPSSSLASALDQKYGVSAPIPRSSLEQSLIDQSSQAFKDLSYWENPVNVGKTWDYVRNLKQGEALPGWIDYGNLKTIYEYMSYKNNTQDYWKWKPLAKNDPGYAILTALPKPPEGFKSSGATITSMTASGAGYNVLQKLVSLPETISTWGLTKSQYDQLPIFNKLVLNLFGQGSPINQTALGGTIGLALGGPGGGLLGGGLGFAASKNQKLQSLMMKIDIPAEWLERSLGMLELGYGRGITEWQKNGFEAGARAVKELLDNPLEFSRAAGYFYEVFPTTVGKQAGFEKWNPSQAEYEFIPPEQRGLNALYDVFKLLQDGASPEEAHKLIIDRYGMIADLKNMTGHILLDPLLKVHKVTGEGTKFVADKIGDPALKAAVDLSEGRPLQTFSTYREMVKTNYMESYARLMERGGETGHFARWALGIDEEGKLKNITPTKPGALNYLTNLTPSAKVNKFLNDADISIASVIDRADMDPDMAYKYVKGLANTPADVGRELGVNFLGGPEAQVIPLALRDFMEGVGKDSIDTWHNTETQRGILERLSIGSGLDADTILTKLKNAKNTQGFLDILSNAARNAGETGQELVGAIANKEISVSQLDDIKKLFIKDALPYNKKMWVGKFYASMNDAMDTWSKDYFGVKPDPLFVRLGKAVKSGQTLVLLGGNPTYPANNYLYNIGAMTAEGVSGFDTSANINAYWQRVGIAPNRLRAGIGLSGEGELSFFEVRKAMMKKGPLQTFSDITSKANRKLGIFSKVAAQIESTNSAQAVTAAFKQTMGGLHRRGIGFDYMPAELVNAIDSVHPGASDYIYAAIERSLNQDEIVDHVFSKDVSRKPVDNLIGDVSKLLGKDEMFIRDAFDKLGIMDDLRNSISLDANDASVNHAFDNLVKHFETRLDDWAKIEIKTAAEEATLKVKIEGGQAIFDQYYKAEQAELLRWVENFDEIEQAINKAETMTPADGDALVMKTLENQGHKWARMWAYKKATYLGIAEGLGASELGNQFVSMLDENVSHWKEFFDYRNSEMSKIGTTKYKSWQEKLFAYKDLGTQMEALYQQHTGTELHIWQRMTDLFSMNMEAQYGAEAGQAARAWMDGVGDVRRRMIEAMILHRQNLKGLDASGRAEAWGNFIEKTYKPLMYEGLQKKLQGAAEIWGQVKDMNPSSKTVLDETNLPKPTYSQAVENEFIQRISPEELANLSEEDVHNIKSQISREFGEIPSEEVARTRIFGPTLRNLDPLSLKETGWKRGVKGLFNKINSLREAAGLEKYPTIEDVPFREAMEVLADQLPAEQANTIKEAMKNWRRDVEEYTGEPINILSKSKEPVVDMTAQLGGTVEGMKQTPSNYHMFNEYWNDTALPFLNELRRQMLLPENIYSKKFKLGNLSPDLQAGLHDYLQKIYGQMADTKNTAIRVALMRRDAALFDYHATYGIDNYIQTVLPYSLFYTREGLTWMARIVDRPAWLANMARLRQLQADMETQPGFPTRLLGKVKIPIPFGLADKWGGAIYVDPWHQLFPIQNVIQPLERLFQQDDNIRRQAIYALQEQLGDGGITEQQAQQALDNPNDPIWQAAMAEAKANFDQEISNPFDFISIASGPSLPISIAYQYLRGTPEKINPLPITRFIQSITSPIKAGGVNIEAPLRRTLGLPEGGQYGDYRINRELANMVAEGLVPLDEAMRAMNDKQGSVYQAALDRSGKMMGIRNLGQMFWTDFFPEGEQKQRGYGQQLSAAINSKDPTAITAFFNAHPEYQARMLSNKFDNPEDMMRTFLKSQIWEKYLALPQLHKDAISEAFGNQFTDNFSNKETRNYDLIDTPTLAMWAQELGAILPKNAPAVPGGALQNIQLPDKQTTQDYQNYLTTKRTMYPNIWQVENLYYNQPQEDQAHFLKQFPELSQYLAWKYKQLSEHPNIIKYAIGEDNQLKNVDPQVAAQVYGYRYERLSKYPNYSGLENQYYNLPEDQRTDFMVQNQELQDYWNWKDQYLASHPNVIPLVISDDNELKGVDPQLAAEVYRYRAERARNYPDIFRLQATYYSFPAGSTDRKAFLKSYPQLAEYWDWQKVYLANHPQIIPYVKSTESIAESVLGKNYQEKYGTNYKPNLNEFGASLVSSLMGYYYRGQNLGEGARKLLYQIWIGDGSPGGNFNVYLNTILRPSFVP